VYGRFLRDFKFQNYEYAVLFLDPTHQTKGPSDLFHGEMCSTKLKFWSFLVGICMEGTLEIRVEQNQKTPKLTRTRIDRASALKVKKSDALVVRVWTFHTLRNSNFFFRKIQSELLEILKKRKLWKHYLKAHLCKISALQHIFDIFSRKYQDFSGNHLSKFQEILNLSMQFHT
jgi:hypothetical protein